MADTGIDAATGDLVRARTVRVTGPGSVLARSRHVADLKLWYVEGGNATMRCGGTSTQISTGDAIAVPAGVEYSLSDCTADLRLYEVTVPV